MTHTLSPGAGRLLLVIGLALLVAPRARAAERSAVDPEVAKLVGELGADDPAGRERAAEQLSAMGRVARPALVTAMNGRGPGAVPQVRLAAAELVMKLPFDRPGDPGAFVGMLQRYGTTPPANRVTYLRTLATFGSGAGADGPGDGPALLLRLMDEEPLDELRWVIVGHFRRTVDPKRWPPARAFDATCERGPNLALAGLAREGTDPAAANRWYARCVAAEILTPTPDAGEMDAVFQSLSLAALSATDYEAAAGVLRAKHSRGTTSAWPVRRSADRYTPLDEVFALHADFGPLHGFAKDVVTYQNELGRPQIVYAMGRMYERSGGPGGAGGQPLVADALCRAGYAIGFGSPATRDASGEFLAARMWEGLARQEFETVLALNKTGEAPSYAANAHLRLGYMAGRRGEDFRAAEHLRMGMETLKSLGHTVTHTKGERRVSGKEAEDRVWAEIHWRYLRAARDAHDSAAADRALDGVMTYGVEDDQVAADVVPALLEKGRAAEADVIFDRAYADVSKQLEARPADVYGMNKMAWLCARSGRKLDEARRLIDAAVEAQPRNSSFLDTAAEVAFRQGDARRAVELEERAVAIKPDEPFLREQLNRFREKLGK